MGWATFWAIFFTIASGRPEVNAEEEDTIEGFVGPIAAD
jgi:hypothetical protein